MYIAELEITDLRSFAGVQRISLDRGSQTYAGWTVFAGRNGAGKSTLLKAIAAATVGPLAARSLASTFPGWVRSGCSAGRAAVRIVPDILCDQFTEKGATVKGTFWSGLEWRDPGAGSIGLDRWLALEPTAKKAAERGPWADSPKGWFIAGYGPYRHLGPATAEVAKVSQDGNLARLVNLYNESATLSDAVDWLKQLHLRALENKSGAAELRDEILRLLGDGLLPDGSRVEKVDSDGLWIYRDGVTLPLEHVSDGYRTVTALVVDLARRLQATYGSLRLTDSADGHLACPLPGVVLIDEVDAHLHVRWQQDIGFWLTTRFPALQFLVTTHSPFICQAASPKGIIRLPAPGEDGPMRHIDDRLFTTIVNGGADDAAMSELFGLDHAHSQRSEKLRRDLAGLELKVIRGVASIQEAATYKALKQQLPSDLGSLADQKVRAVSETGVQ